VRCHVRRSYADETRYGLYTNLRPFSAIDRLDRETIGTWYLVVHAGPLHLDICGIWR